MSALNFSNMRICFVVVAIHDVSSVAFYFHYAYKKYGYCFPSKETKFPLKFKKVLYVCIIKSVSNDFKKGSLGAKKKNTNILLFIYCKQLLFTKKLVIMKKIVLMAAMAALTIPNGFAHKRIGISLGIKVHFEYGEKKWRDASKTKYYCEGNGICKLEIDVDSKSTASLNGELINLNGQLVLNVDREIALRLSQNFEDGFFPINTEFELDEENALKLGLKNTIRVLPGKYKTIYNTDTKSQLIFLN